MKYVAIILLCIVSCGQAQTESSSLQADFTALPTDTNPNYILFTDKSSGSYNLAEWDFGQGETAENVKTKLVYFPFAGEYTALLTIWKKGVSSKAKKKITIANSAVTVDFTVAITDTNSNYIAITNRSKNTDSVRWDCSWGKSFSGKELSTGKGVLLAPYRGSHTITLNAFSKGKKYTTQKQIEIKQDIPNLANKMSLVWADEFDGNDLDEKNWTFMLWGAGKVNNEWQRYVKNPANYNVQNGVLSITAVKEGENRLGGYTSTRIESVGKREFLYGRIEIRAQMPNPPGKGSWPALWCLGNNINTVGWPACGEIDIMEYVGYKPNKTHATVHTPSGYAANGQGSGEVPLERIEEEFNTFGIIWTPTKIDFYVNDLTNIIFTYNPANKNKDTWPFDHPFYLILNFAVGGDWGGVQGVDGNTFPQTIKVDYVRVYQP